MFSIIINNYNYGRYLRQAVESALAQNVPDIEILVVDDGSKDDSLEILTSYGDRIQVIAKKNGGQASTFNAGFAVAEGEWVLFLDADDVLDPDACTQALAFVEIHKEIDWIEFRLRCLDEKGIPLEPPQVNPRVLEEPPLIPKLLKRGSAWFSPTSGILFSRKLLEELLPMPEEDFRICADLYLQIGAAFLGNVGVMPQAVLGGYRIHGQNNFHASNMTASDLEYRWLRDQHLESIKQETIRGFARRSGRPVPKHFPATSPTFLFRRLYLRIQRPEAGISDSIPGLIWRQIQGMFSPQSARGLRTRLKIFVYSARLLLMPKSKRLLWVVRNVS